MNIQKCLYLAASDKPGRKSGNDSKNIQNDFLQIKFPSKQICPKFIWQMLKLILSMKYIWEHIKQDSKSEGLPA